MDSLIPNIECEVRTFITDEQHAALFEKLKRIAMFGGDDEQLTCYLEGNGNQDLRIQRSSLMSKVILKKGRVHDESRTEIEVEFLREDFGKMLDLLENLGYHVVIKWFRKRYVFKIDNINVMLDDTKGYGKILELDKVCFEEERDGTLKELHAKLEELGVQPTPREEFEKRYVYYKEHWHELTGEP